MRVAIAEDDAVYRTGLSELLTAAGVTVVCQASSGPELLDYLTRDEPDAVLLDIRMAGRPDDGLVTADIIAGRYPAVGIVLLSSYANGDFIRRFFRHGTAGRGYLLKQRFNDITDVSFALELTRRGQTLSDISIMNRLHRPEPTLAGLLTPRELDVLRFIAAGLTNAAIATSMGIRDDQVEYATQSIYTKLGRCPGENPRVRAAIRYLEERRDQ